MTHNGRGDVLSARAEQAIEAEERAAAADEKRWNDAEHEVATMLHHEPKALIDMFHNHVREIADLDAMDAALIAFLKNERDGQPSDFYNAVVRIVMEQSK